MTRKSAIKCGKCGMLGHRQSSFLKDSTVCIKCQMLDTLESKLSQVEKRLHSLESTFLDRTSAKNDSAVQHSNSLDCPISKSPTKATYADVLARPSTSQNSVVTVCNPLNQEQDNFTPVRQKKSPNKKSKKEPCTNSNNLLIGTPKKTYTKTNDLVIGTSIVRNVVIPHVPLPVCLPGARMGDIIGHLKLMKQAGKKFRRVVIHAGGNDTRRKQSEVLKLQVAEACDLAKSISDSIIFSGPLPNLSSDEMYSRHLSFNRWLSNYTKNNHIGFIDNWSSFWGKPDLISKDQIHPTRNGSAVLANNIKASLQPLEPQK